jgi:hypothetical protein
MFGRLISPPPHPTSNCTFPCLTRGSLSRTAAAPKTPVRCGKRCWKKCRRHFTGNSRNLGLLSCGFIAVVAVGGDLEGSARFDGQAFRGRLLGPRYGQRRNCHAIRKIISVLSQSVLVELRTGHVEHWCARKSECLADELLDFISRTKLLEPVGELP